MRVHSTSCVILLVVFSLVCGSSARSSPAAEPGQESERPLSISGVKTSACPFDPANGERVDIRFELSKAARVTLHIFDPDFELVAQLIKKELLAAGSHTVTWNGRDVDGVLVPDEAYLFTIEAEDASGQFAVYDPLTFSGGEVYDVSKADLDPASHKVSYPLAA